ncbi:hypothetical protein BH10ACT7_BH10ACT7_28050 [soil metagenome]
MARRILSIGIALVATALGYAAAWTGGTTIAQYAQMGRPMEDLLAVPLLVLGVALLAIGALTVWLSSAGVLVVGAIHVLVGILYLVLPPAGLRQGFAPIHQLLNSLNDLSREISYGAFYTVPTGWGLLTGAALIAVGLGVRLRRTPSTTTNRALAIGAAVILGVPGALLVLGGGGMVFRSAVVTLQPPTVFALLGVFIGTVLVAATAYLARWSSAGVIVLGAAVSVAGILFIVANGPISGALLRICDPLVLGIGAAGATGNVLLAGVVIAAAGVGAKLRADRALRASV